MQRLHLLGPVRVDQVLDTPDETVENVAPERNSGNMPRFRSRRTIALLGYLAAERRPVARAFLASLFWPDDDPSKGRGNLRRELHNLAQVLPDCWDLDRQMVAFTPSEKTEVDIYAVGKLEAQENWVEAAELLGGEFLEALYLDDNFEFENWLLGERDCWRQRAERLLTRVIEGQTRRGRYRDALKYSRSLMQFDPWNEQNHRQIMRLLAWTGQRGAALRQFETCKQVLNDELNIDPSDDTVTLYQQILAGELDLSPQIPAFLTNEAARHEVAPPLFVARERELALLSTALNGALAGQGRVIFVAGGPGRGKTVLMAAFAQQAMEKHPHLLVVSGNCNAYAGKGDPYLPFRDLMAMLTGDVETKWDAGAITREHARRLWGAMPLVVRALLDHLPHLIEVLVPNTALLARAAVYDQTGAQWLSQLKARIHQQQKSSQDIEQSYLFQQITNMLQAVAEQRPLLLILDDMQWADTASIGLLFHLSRRLAETNNKVLIICAYRPEEITLGRDGKRHPLAKPLSELKRTFGDVFVELTQPEETEARRFVDAILDIQPNRLTESFRAAMLQRTGAHPLFTIELLRTMQERGDLYQDKDGYWVDRSTLDWDTHPSRVEAVIEERINRLEPELQEVLTIASVEGETFTAQVVSNAIGVGERRILGQLSSELEQRHRLVRELDEVETGQGYLARYKFSHVLFQDYLYKRLGSGERRLLHRDVASEIEELYKGQLDEMAVQLAHHYHKAGEYERALRYYIQAGERAARSYASGEAVTHFTQAIELAEKVSAKNVSLTELHRERGLASETLGEFEQARLDHTKALQIAQKAGERRGAWRALIDLGKLWRARDYDQTHDYFDAALALARQMDDPMLLADSLNWMGNWYANVDKTIKAVEYHREALKIVKQLGNKQKLAITLDLLGIANLLGGNTEASVSYYNKAIELFRELDDRPRLATSLLGRASNFSFIQTLLASTPATLRRDPLLDLNEALQISIEIDSAPDQAWSYWVLGQLHTIHGQFGHALANLRTGLRIASEIRHREFIVAHRFALGVLYNELFAPEIALVQLEEALDLAAELNSQNLVHDITGALVKTYILLDDWGKGETCLAAVLSPETRMDTAGIRYCWARSAELALIQGNPSLARDIVERLIASPPGISTERVITFLWMIKGEALAAMDETEEAIPLLFAAKENALAGGERFLLWRVHASLGRLYNITGNQDAADEEFSAASVCIDELAATIPDAILEKKFRLFESFCGKR